MPYQSPGGAFSNSIGDFLLRQEVSKRQAQQDAIAARRANDEHEEAMAALQDSRMQSALKIEAKEQAQIEKEVGEMLDGDIPTERQKRLATKYHVPMRMKADPDQGTALPAPEMPAPPPGVAATPMPAGQPQLPQAEPMPAIRFAGSKAEILAARQKTLAQTQQQTLAKALEGAKTRPEAVRIALGQGVPPAQIDDVVNSIMGPKATLPASAQEFEYSNTQRAAAGQAPQTYKEYQDEDANRKEKVARAGAGGGLTDPQKVSALTRAQGDWDKLTADFGKIDFNTNNMRSALNAIKADPKVRSGGDQVIITSFNKITDPASVVRESEYARVPENSALLERYQEIYNKVTKGGSGVPLRDLEDLVNLAEQMRNNAARSTRLVTGRQRISARMTRAGIPLDEIFFPGDPGEETPEKGSPAAANPNAPKRIRYDITGKRLP